MKVKLETTSTIYRELFTVKFLHSGYETPQENFLSKGLRINPDEETKNLFTTYKMDYRFFSNVLVCYMQSSLFAPPAPEPKVPFIEIEGDIKIRFLVQNSGDFFDKTYVVAAGNKRIYQFSNKTNNVSGTTVFLSASVEDYATAKDYDQGTIVQNAGNLFNTRQPVLAANNIPLTDVSFWQQLTPFEQVVNNADLQDAATVDTNEDCFAVIDMYNNGTTNDSYKLFGNNEELFNPAPAFTIKFKSKF